MYRVRHNHVYSKRQDAPCNGFTKLDSFLPSFLPSFVPFFPGSEVRQRNSRHKLEIQAPSANQTVDRDIVTDFLEFGKVFIDDLGNGLETCRSRLVSIVLASPFSADAVEGHGTVGQRDIVQSRGRLADGSRNGSKCLDGRRFNGKNNNNVSAELPTTRGMVFVSERSITTIAYRGRSQSSNEKGSCLHGDDSCLRILMKAVRIVVVVDGPTSFFLVRSKADLVLGGSQHDVRKRT
jgi:hypothetical protein